MRNETQVLTAVELEIHNLALRRFSLWESFKSLNVKNAIGTPACEGRPFRNETGPAWGPPAVASPRGSATVLVILW